MGEYICFVDGDDYINKNHISCLLNEINDYVDLIVCNFNVINNGTITNSSIKVKNKYGFYKSLDNKNGYVWNKLFKKKIILDNSLFDKMEAREDVVFISKYFMFVNEYKIIDAMTYNYVIRDGSATNSGSNGYDISHRCSRLKANQSLEHFYSENTLMYNYYHNLSIEMFLNVVFLTRNKEKKYNVKFYNLRKDVNVNKKMLIYGL